MSPIMSRCPSCSAEYSDSNYCPNCGQPTGGQSSSPWRRRRLSRNDGFYHLKRTLAYFLIAEIIGGAIFVIVLSQLLHIDAGQLIFLLVVAMLLPTLIIFGIFALIRLLLYMRR